MRAERRLRMLFGIVLTVQTLTALSGIVLLERMTPAIGRILAENVRSISAIEGMLAAIASEDAGRSERFAASLATARGNVTVQTELPELTRIEAGWEAALQGDSAARAQVVHALSRLGVVNREAMWRADAEAKRIDGAGRWALAIFALLGFGVSFIATRRAREDLLVPIAELASVAHARQRGDRLRRVTRLPGDDLEGIAVLLNELLDDEARVARRSTATNVPDTAILALLDEFPKPALIVDKDGVLVAFSRSALDLMETRGDTALRRVRDGDDANTRTLGESGWRLVPL